MARRTYRKITVKHTTIVLPKSLNFSIAPKSIPKEYIIFLVVHTLPKENAIVSYFDTAKHLSATKRPQLYLSNVERTILVISAPKKKHIAVRLTDK